MSVNASLSAAAPSCFQSRAAFSNLTALLVTHMLLLMPLCVYVLCLSCHHWRKQAVSHSDVFTLNIVFLELFGVCGSFLYYYGTYWAPWDGPRIAMAGLYVTCLILPAQTLFSLFKCVDLYLAVAHPVTYLGLKQSSGALIRNISVACVWLLCVVSGAQMLKWAVYFILNILFLIVSFATVGFCCLSVLLVLIRPGPGEAGDIRKRAGPSTQRAPFTITAVMGALLTRFWAILSFYAIMASPVSSSVDYCSIMLVLSWLSLPSSVVLLLLFLHRAGKLAAKPGQREH